MLYVVDDKPSVREIAGWLHDHSDKIPATQWALVDARAMTKKHPATFEVPTFAEIEGLDVGASVKLLFDIGDEEEPAGERMWVTIIKIAGHNYVGELDNDPAVIRGLKYKDKIHFTANNIARIWEE